MKNGQLAQRPRRRSAHLCLGVFWCLNMIETKASKEDTSPTLHAEVVFSSSNCQARIIRIGTRWKQLVLQVGFRGVKPAAVPRRPQETLVKELGMMSLGVLIPSNGHHFGVTQHLMHGRMLTLLTNEEGVRSTINAGLPLDPKAEPAEPAAA